MRAPTARALRPARRAWAALVGGPGAATEIHLTWSESPARSLTVCWAGSSRRNPARVEHRAAEGGAWERTAGWTRPRPGSAGHLHTAILRGLEPGRRYAYRVSCDPGHESAWSPAFETQTAPGSPDAPFEAIFLCDVGLAGRPDGTCAAVPAVLAALSHPRPLFVLGGGDFAYANRDPRFLDPADATGAWFEQMQPLLARVPFMAQLGNHEVEIGERADDWLARWPIDDTGRTRPRSYSFDVGPVHFVGLHAPGRAPSAHDLRWLEADLTSDAARAARWRVVFQHAPLFAHGTAHPARADVRALASCFARLGVDLHLSGHDQSYERTHVLDADGGITRPRGGSGGGPDDPSRYAAGAGVLYAKVSPAGKLSDRGRDFSRLPEAAAPEIAARSDRGHHWARLRVEASALQVDVSCLAEPEAPPVVIDSFRLEAGTRP
jgi:hypothetical protein